MKLTHHTLSRDGIRYLVLIANHDSHNQRELASIEIAVNQPVTVYSCLSIISFAIALVRAL